MSHKTHQQRIARANRAMPEALAAVLNPRLTNNTQPHSFVLADLFDVESMSCDVPEHLYEDDLGLEYTCCPDCDGRGWQDVDESAWNSAYWTARGRLLP